MPLNSITRVPTAEEFALARGQSKCVLLLATGPHWFVQSRISLELSQYECTRFCCDSTALLVFHVPTRPSNPDAFSVCGNTPTL